MKNFEPLVPARAERWAAVAAVGVVACSLAAAWSTAGPGNWVPAKTLAALRGETPVVRLEPVLVVARRESARQLPQAADESVACAAGAAKRPG